MWSVTREDFTDKVLRRLGAPVVDINVDSEQVDDLIDQAFNMYYRYNVDATECLAIVYTMTDTDITNQYITTPPEIVSVTDIILDDNGLIMGGFGSNLWHSLQNIMYDINFGEGAAAGGLTEFSSMMTYLAELNFTFNIKKTINFSLVANRLQIQTDWSNIYPGFVAILEVYRKLDPDEFPAIYNDIWLVDYTAALIGVQWGRNLSKFSGIELPSGVTLDSAAILSMYGVEKTRLEEELRGNYELPVNFIVG